MIPSPDAALGDGLARSASQPTTLTSIVHTTSCPHSIWEVWTLAIAKINIRPVLNPLDQFFAEGVFQDVIHFLPTAFVVAEAMFKKVSLPLDADFFRCPLFPFADNEPDGFVGWRERQQRVQMVGHQKKNMRPPNKILLPVTNGFKQLLRRFRHGQLIAEPFFAVDGDEINFLMWIHPQRNLVRQTLGRQRFHASKTKQTPGGGQLQIAVMNQGLVGVVAPRLLLPVEQAL